MTETITFTLDGREIAARLGESILQAARRHGFGIPHLCYKDGLRADGNCRACVVEIAGERMLAPSCCRAPADGMEVRAQSGRARAAQKMVIELLQSDMPATAARADSELDLWAQRMGVGAPRFPRRAQPAADFSHPAIAVRLDACIQCTRCLRACREVQANDVIGYAHRGEIVFDLADPMGRSSCVACGECVQACPPGALLPADVSTPTGALPPAGFVGAGLPATPRRKSPWGLAAADIAGEPAPTAEKVRARADAGLARGTVFMPFCYAEAAANLLTNPVLDPVGKIPEFKYCAARLTRAG